MATFAAVNKQLVLLFILACSISLTSSASNKTKSSTCSKVKIQCRDGVMLPAWVTPGNAGGTALTAARAFVYLISMFFFFLGISIISDRFMSSIEIITSQEKEIAIKDKKTGKKQIVTVKIWNETVSNLTLMALGSSAPEILLSVIEIVGRNFEAGELGPSTVVGSAAFNLFMITAVCVSVLPPGETRRIKHLRVFAFTASCSVGAYVWMYIILSVSSPGIIEVWEGIVTLLCFPGMVGAAYLIDIKISFHRFLRRKIRKTKKHGHTVIQTGDGDILAVSVKDGNNMEKNHSEFDALDNNDIEYLGFAEGDDPEEHMNEKKRIAMEAYHRARSKAPDADAATLQHLVEQENMKLQHKSRAFYRIQATHRMTGQGNILKLKSDKVYDDPNKKGGPNSSQALQLELDEINANARRAGVQGTSFYFHPSEYTVVESCGTCYLTVIRVGEDLFDTCYVDYETADGTANAGADYEEVKGTLVFKPGDTSHTIAIPIVDDDVFELDEYFHCKLTGVRSDRNGLNAVVLGQPDTATITVLDDDYPGVFTLENEKYEVMETVGILTLRIVRLIGARGIIRVPYHTEEGSARGGGEDFEDCIGEVEFTDEETVKIIEIQVVDNEEYEKHKVFSVVLGEPKIVRCSEAHISNLDSIEDQEMRKILEAGKPALGDHKRSEVHIVECKEFKKTIDSMLGRANMANFLKSSSWVEQFKEAFQVEAGGDDDDDDSEVEPSYFDYVMHYLSLFWKVLFALVPPTDIWNGWGCFVVAIGMIGVLTAVTGDLASHFGCVVGLADSVVAISFVALGTSLPDTFASKVATINDETADSSIGNVTGSNSVNVFLGIGAAWLIAAVYHTANGRNFEVSPGSLGFSVLVFCILALICISTLMFRRFHPNIQAELGGPAGSRKVATISDETADGSIGNVTGSNSVNVFLGIGLAWSVAAIYHASQGRTFDVEPGSLGFSVVVFCIEALVCIAVIMYRRNHKDIQAELGGPSGYRKISSAFFATLWILYILLSALETYCYINISL